MTKTAEIEMHRTRKIRDLIVSYRKQSVLYNGTVHVKNIYNGFVSSRDKRQKGLIKINGKLVYVCRVPATVIWVVDKVYKVKGQ